MRWEQASRKLKKIKDIIPNIITVTRMFLFFLVALAIIINCKEIEILFCTALIYISDLVDGYMARILNATSLLGRRLDVMADGLYVVGITGIFTYRALISPIVLVSIIVEYLFFVFTAKILSSREHHIYDMVGRFVAGYYYIFTGILIIIWIRDLSVAMLLHQLSLVCVGLTIIGCVCRLWTIYIRILKGRIRHE